MTIRDPHVQLVRMQITTMSLTELAQTVEQLTARVVVLETDKAEKDAALKAEANIWSSMAAGDRLDCDADRQRD